MPEIAGQAACIIDPSQPEDITAALYRLTNDKSYRDELIKNGFIQAQKFSWRTMAEKVLAIYREIGAEGNNKSNA